MRVIFHAAAETEMNEAANYYERESEGLGSAFLSEIARVVEMIQEFPESGVVVRGITRCKALRKFPYSLLYRITGESIRIFAVMHHHRRPFYWQKRN